MSRRSSEERGKRRPNTKSPYSDKFLGFVDIYVTDADREALTVYMQPGQVDLEGFIQTVLEDGYKLTVAGDYEHSCVVTTLTGRSDTCENKGYAMSARGPDAHSALVVLWYKHTVTAHWGKWTDESDVDPAQLPLWR